MKSESFVNNAIEESAVCDIINVKMRFLRLDCVDGFAKLSLYVEVLAEFVGDPGQSRSCGVAISGVNMC